jgi:hypothetical protein
MHTLLRWGLRYLVTIALVSIWIIAVPLFEFLLWWVLNQFELSIRVFFYCHRSIGNTWVWIQWLAVVTSIFSLLKLQISQLRLQPFSFAVSSLMSIVLAGMIGFSMFRRSGGDMGLPGLLGGEYTSSPDWVQWLGLSIGTSLLVVFIPLTMMRRWTDSNRKVTIFQFVASVGVLIFTLANVNHDCIQLLVF